LEGVARRVVIAGIGTDGVDGPTAAAGAAATPESVARARALGLDPQAMLENNDSHSFFSTLGDCIITGPTGTNVNDLVIVLMYPS
jgi:hydroxypyruvate reductase